MASKDLVAIASPFAQVVPPSQYMFDFTQNLLVAGALLLLLSYRGLEDRNVMHSTLKEVDKCVDGLSCIEKVFAGGKVGVVSKAYLIRPYRSLVEFVLPS